MTMPKEYKKCLICDCDMELKEDGGEMNGVCPKRCTELEFDFEGERLFISIFVEFPLLTAHFNEHFEPAAGIHWNKKGFAFRLRSNKNRTNYPRIDEILKDEKDFEKAIKMIQTHKKNNL